MEKFVKRPSSDVSLSPAPPTKKSTPELSHLTVTAADYAFLMNHGYLVKLNVVPEDDCERAQLAFEESLKVVNPSASNPNPQNWQKNDLPANVHGIQEMGKLAHQQCVVDIRLHPHVVVVWRSLLKTEKISSSFDRVNYMPVTFKEGGKPWHHTDVDPAFAHRKDVANYVPVQSYVQVSRTSNKVLRTEPLSADEHGEASIVLWEHSNLAHAEYFKRKGPDFKLKAKNWHIYEPEAIMEWEKDGKDYLPASHPARVKSELFPMRRLEVRAPRGAMVFWLSQTAHMNTAGRHPAFPRFVVYVCFGPALQVTKKDRENFWKAIAQQRCTTHWPCAGEVKLFPKTPHLFSAERVDNYRAMEARLDLKPLTFTPAQCELLPKPV